MKRLKTILKAGYSRKVIIYLLMCCLVLNTWLPAVLATPTGASPDLRDGGGMSITYNTGEFNNTTLVNVHTTRTIINWESLNTRGGAANERETLAFTQTGMYGNSALTDSAVLNRVSGAATQFNGDLVAPGMRIFIVNPAGIVFGSESTVNVTQLVASGLNMSNQAFKDVLDDAGKQMVFSDGNGKVENYGTINANSVILVGKKVINVGPITADEGLVVMAAGDKVFLAQDGSEVLVELLADPLNTTDDIHNGGSIIADNGKIILAANEKIILAAGDPFSRAVSNIGTLAAAGGEVTIQASKIKNKGLIDVSSSINGGSVALTGTEEVVMGTGGIIEANAGDNIDGGDGGSVTIQTDGLFRMDEGSSITAAGGSVSGKGGSVTINCDKFEILGDISASPVNASEEPGKLEINTLTDVIIADGASTGATNALYENDIEALSLSATNLIVKTEGNITVQDITDDWGSGEITGQFGDIELHATGDDSAVTFEDSTDTIRTTLGDIVIEAGSGGINVGNLITGKSVSDLKPTPGQILLSTSNEGDITTGDLLIGSGSGLAKIDVDSSGNLTVNGDVIVGSESDIRNVFNGQNAHAAVYLSAADNVEINGNVGAYAKGVNDEITENDVTTAEVRILAGIDEDLTGDAFIGGDIIADAQSSDEGTAEAIVEVDAWGEIEFADGAEVHAMANGVAVESTGPEYEDDEAFSEDDPPDHAQIIINPQHYPTPPLKGFADEYSTPKSESIPVDVLANDMQNGEIITDGTIYSFTDPTAGTVTPTMSGDRIVGLTYNPPEDFSTLTFDENGEATVTFTYVGKLVIEDEQLLSEPTTVTITLINELPEAVTDSAKTFQDQAITFNVTTNDIDLDVGDLLTAIEGAVAPKNGTLVLNEDGTFTYTPNKGFLGEDSFTYSVTDGLNTSSEVEVNIKVTEEPPMPKLLLPYIYPAPGLDRLAQIEIEISGCPALAKWVAEELGVDEGMVDIWMANSLASTKGIQPYDAYSQLMKAALILKDDDGTHIAALAQVMDEFASSIAPPTEEQMAAIVDAIRGNTDEDSYYALADEYLDALVTYIGILNSEMGFSTTKSVQFVTNKYISRLNQDQNAGVTAFLSACLAVLGG
jgi:filamentous hemagglutinin family protein